MGGLAARPWSSIATTDLPQPPQPSPEDLKQSVAAAGALRRDVTEPDLHPPIASDVTDNGRLHDPAEGRARASSGVISTGAAGVGALGSATEGFGATPTAPGSDGAAGVDEPELTVHVVAEPGHGMGVQVDSEPRSEAGSEAAPEAAPEPAPEATPEAAEEAATSRSAEPAWIDAASDDALKFEEPVLYSSLRETLPSMRAPRIARPVPDVSTPEIREVGGRSGGWTSTFEAEDDTGARPVPWSGTLETVPAVEVLAKLIEEAASGELELRCGLIWKRVRIYKGLPMSITSNMGMELIGEHLVKARIVSRRDLDRALHASEVESGSLSDKLIEFGLIDRALLEAELGKNLGARLDEALEWRWGTFDFVAQDITPPDILPRLDFKAILENARTRRADSDERAQAAAALTPEAGADRAEASGPEGKLEEALKYARTIADGTGKGRKDKLGSSSTKPVR